MPSSVGRGAAKLDERRREEVELSSAVARLGSDAVRRRREAPDGRECSASDDRRRERVVSIFRRATSRRRFRAGARKMKSQALALAVVPRVADFEPLAR